MKNAGREVFSVNSRVEELTEYYKLEKHPEGGSFSESYTTQFENNGRALAGSIYFLLDAGEISHFHQLDCDEIWYFHEGCGLKVTVITHDGAEELLLGSDHTKGELYSVLIPKGAIFGAENLRSDEYTLVSCVTAPKFDYRGFRLVGEDEIKNNFSVSDDLLKRFF